MNDSFRSTSRVSHLDLAAGILMLWIITFHAVNGSKVFGNVDARVAIPFLTFSMPWFYYKSGSFFRRNREGEGLERDVRKLLFPYLKWTILGFLAYLTMMAIDGTFCVEECLQKPLDTFWIYGYVPLDVPVWFVLSLFMVKVLAHFLFKLKVHPLFLVVLGFGVAFSLHVADNQRIPVYFSNIPMGLAFFMLGNMCHQYEEKLWVFVPCLVGYLLFLFLDTPVVGLHRNVYLGGNYYLWPLFSICGIVAFNNLCKWLCLAFEKIATCHFRPISFIGQYSIQLLVSHAFVYMPVLHYSKFPPMQTFLLIEGIYFLILIPAIFLWNFRRKMC